MTYMISSFATSTTTKMALIQPTATSSAYATSAGTYTIPMASIQQSAGFNLTLSSGAVVLPEGEYVAFFRVGMRNTTQTHFLSYTADLLLNGAVASQLSVISEQPGGTVSQYSTVPLGGARFSASQNSNLSMRFTKAATASNTETFSSQTCIVLIRL